MKALIDKCKKFGERDGYLPLIDQRQIILRKFEHKVLTNTALNCLLQGSGSVCVKNWIVAVNLEIERRKLDAQQVIFYHDELVLDCHPSVVDEVIEILKEKIAQVGIDFGMRIPLACDVHVGKTWGDIH